MSYLVSVFAASLIFPPLQSLKILILRTLGKVQKNIVAIPFDLSGNEFLHCKQKPKQFPMVKWQLELEKICKKQSIALKTIFSNVPFDLTPGQLFLVKEISQSRKIIKILLLLVAEVYYFIHNINICLTQLEPWITIAFQSFVYANIYSHDLLSLILFP